METEIREQPVVLARNADRYVDEFRSCLSERRFEMVLLVARGSSDNAALYGRYLIETHLKIPVSLAAPSVLTRYGARIRYPRCLAIGISQSGAAPDVAEVLATLREDGHTTVAITNTPESRITQTAGHSLILDTGPEHSVAATKTYTASLLALYQLVRALNGDLPEPSLPDMEWCDRACDAAAKSSGFLLRSQVAFALARGYGFCTAMETALKLMECALLPCKSYSSADFQHGPKALAGPGCAVIDFDGHAADLESQGAKVIVAPKPKGVPEPLLPIYQIFFGQWLALIAARARAFDPDHPQFIQKVTETR